MKTKFTDDCCPLQIEELEVECEGMKKELEKGKDEQRRKVYSLSLVPRLWNKLCVLFEVH